MRHVLDSNVVIAAFNGDAGVTARLLAVAPTEVGIPHVVVAELLYGARRSSRREENLARVRGLRAAFSILRVSDETIERYAEIRAAVARRGRSKTDFDLLIACAAMEWGATLVTHDSALSDGAIAGLAVENWLET